MSYILSRETIIESDITFFDIFRFIDIITLDNEEYHLTEMKLGELYDLFLLLDINILNSITKHINSNLGDLNKLRSIEADFSFFVDL